jgi:hypothetical protein
MGTKIESHLNSRIKCFQANLSGFVELEGGGEREVDREESNPSARQHCHNAQLEDDSPWFGRGF